MDGDGLPLVMVTAVVVMVRHCIRRRNCSGEDCECYESQHHVAKLHRSLPQVIPRPIPCPVRCDLNITPEIFAAQISFVAVSKLVPAPLPACYSDRSEHPLPRFAAEIQLHAHLQEIGPPPCAHRRSRSATGRRPRCPPSIPAPAARADAGHQLSTAASWPPTCARHTATPSASASITFPSAGASPIPHNRTHCSILVLL